MVDMKSQTEKYLYSPSGDEEENELNHKTIEINQDLTV